MNGYIMTLTPQLKDNVVPQHSLLWRTLKDAKERGRETAISIDKDAKYFWLHRVWIAHDRTTFSSRLKVRLVARTTFIDGVKNTYKVSIQKRHVAAFLEKKMMEEQK